MKDININKPFLGYGLGLRTDHYEEILNSEPPIDWFEIISENYMVAGGRQLYHCSGLSWSKDAS